MLRNMLAEYEQNIETVKRILKNLRAKPQDESQQWKIEKYEQMLYDLTQSAGKIRKHLREE